jgi:hypothetical protein
MSRVSRAASLVTFCARKVRVLMQQAVPNDASVASHSLFWEKSEALVATLKRGYLSNFIFDGRLTRQAIVLSDRRLYFFGVRWTNYQGVTRDAGMQVLPLEHISSIAEDHEQIRFMDILRMLGYMILLPVPFGIAALGVQILQDSHSVSRGVNEWLVANGVKTVEDIGLYLGGAVLILGMFLTLACAGKIISLLFHILFGRRHNLSLATQSAAVFIDYRFYGKSAIAAFQKHLGWALTNHRKRIEGIEAAEQAHRVDA